MSDDTPNNGSVDAVARTIAVLQLLIDADEPVSVRRAAERSGISRSAVHRILGRLADHSVAAATGAGRYVAGPLLLEWASRLLSQSSILQAADSVMRQLVDEFDESVYLTLLIAEERRISFVHVVECRQRIKYVVPMGSSGPLHAGAAGKAVLAWLDDGPGDEPLEAFTADTVTDPEALREELEMIRTRGYAVSAGERIPDAAGVGAPIFFDGEVIGSLSLTVPRSRLRSEDLPRFGTRVSERAQQLNRLLAGYSTITGSFGVHQ
jgi:DNA-binding IclR family transcriptional regulator